MARGMGASSKGASSKKRSRESSRESDSKRPKKSKGVAYFETQQRHRCGIHALNNIFRNTSSTRLKRVMFVHGERGCELNPNNTNIDVQKICKEHLVALEATWAHHKHETYKRQVLAQNKCPESGEYQIDVLLKAIRKVPNIDVFQEGHTVGRREFRKSEAERKDFYAYLVAHSKLPNFMGCLVNTSTAGGHYVAIIRHKDKLLWVDSLDKGPKLLTEERFVKEGKRIHDLLELRDTLPETIIDLTDL